jgi:hypothetical protein
VPVIAMGVASNRLSGRRVGGGGFATVLLVGVGPLVMVKVLLNIVSGGGSRDGRRRRHNWLGDGGRSWGGNARSLTVPMCF